jgi:hypothetical protein
MRVLNVQLPVDQRAILMLPRDAEIMSVVVKGGLPHLYYWANEEEGRFDTRVFRIVCAGEHFNPKGWQFVGSFQLNDWFVGHLFEQPASGGYQDHIDDRYAEDFTTIKKEIG